MSLLPFYFAHMNRLGWKKKGHLMSIPVGVLPLVLSATATSADPLGVAVVTKHLSSLATSERPSSIGRKLKVVVPRSPTTAEGKTTHWIVHLGVGGFHRAHLAVYTDEAMGSIRKDVGNDLSWGILGVGLRQEDKPLLDALALQNGRYTVVERQGNQETLRVVSSIKETLLASNREGSAQLLDRISSATTRIVSLTVTPGGYFLKSDKSLDVSHLVVSADVAHVASLLPKFLSTVGSSSPSSLNEANKADLLASFCRSPVGVVALGLLYRFRALPTTGGLIGVSNITVMSCDNIQDNGHLLLAAVNSFIAAVAATPAGSSIAAARLLSKFQEWKQDHCFFPCSMVDRITPVATSADAEYVRTQFHIIDRCPVVCEQFRQWIVEEEPNYVTGGPRRFQRPAAWQSLENVDFVKDVAPYETMKLRLLNGSHLAVACLGELIGLQHIHETMQCVSLRELMIQLMDRETGPTVPPVAGINLKEYKSILVERFANVAILDTVDRVATDAPLAVLVAALHDRIVAMGAAAEAKSPLLILSIASWVLRASGGKGETGRAISVRHPLKEQLASTSAKCANDLVPMHRLLTMILGPLLMERKAFVAALTSAWKALKTAVTSPARVGVKGSRVEAVIRSYLQHAEPIASSNL
ncbi:mannitol dehydrogenase, putative [Bodo saltans]|uniref:Mannitol dehydrogenase, putative n=1 Tax=Bodo saltans TaxID=75058 RepID=A0A0S4IMU7_BODSA|nr:mannitol dehydrogenase, putative [Bodo saltans]|eukprot:CUF54710.1 mannitol dehydrogenase, putative [Bodo saltans]